MIEKLEIQGRQLTVKTTHWRSMSNKRPLCGTLEDVPHLTNDRASVTCAGCVRELQIARRRRRAGEGPSS